MNGQKQDSGCFWPVAIVIGCEAQLEEPFLNLLAHLRKYISRSFGQGCSEADERLIGNRRIRFHQMHFRR